MSITRNNAINITFMATNILFRFICLSPAVDKSNNRNKKYSRNVNNMLWITKFAYVNLIKNK